MARIVLRRGYDCNRCSRKGCAGDVLRDRRGNIRKHLSCPGEMGQTPMKTTLLERASENPGSFNALGVVLGTMGLQFDQVPRYPFFRFIAKDTDEEFLNNNV